MDTLKGPVRVPDGVKGNSEQYCVLLEEAFLPWLDKLSLAKKKQLNFEQDNSPSHSSSKAWQGNKGIKGKNLMAWPLNSHLRTLIHHEKTNLTGRDAVFVQTDSLASHSRGWGKPRTRNHPLIDILCWPETDGAFAEYLGIFL